MHTDSFTVHVKIDDIYKNTAEDVEIRFGTSNFKIDRPIPKGKKRKQIGLMIDEIRRQLIKEFVESTAKTQSYLKDNNDKDKKAKGTKNCAIKRKLKFQDLKTVQEQLKLKIKQTIQIKTKLKQIIFKKINIKNPTKI